MMKNIASATAEPEITIADSPGYASLCEAARVRASRQKRVSLFIE